MVGLLKAWPVAASIGGHCPPPKRTPARPGAPPYGAGLLSLVAHESNHVVIIGALGYPGTDAMSEGLASAVLAEPYRGRSYLHAWVKANASKLRPLAELFDDAKFQELIRTSEGESIGYRSSGSFLAYLLDSYGPGKLKQIYYARSPEFAERFQQAYGRSLADAEADWLRYVGALAG